MNGFRRFALPLGLAFLLVLTATVRPAQAGVSETVLALAGPLAEQFGVPASAVTSLLEGGVSLDSVTQLLLVSQTSSTALSDVTELYKKNESDVARTADELKVAASAYSPDKVSAAIDSAKQQVQADATEKVTDEASKAIGNALGGFQR